MSSEMVFVKGGTFQMGSIDGEENEQPIHSVKVDDFYIGKYLVTQSEWKELMGNNPSYSKGDNLPIEYIDWYDAIEFCNKLSEKEGLKPFYNIDKTVKDPNNGYEGDDKKWSITVNEDSNGYRLPTEAEWEYAARGGNMSKGYKYSGSDNIEEVAWYSGNSDNMSHPVGEKAPNELGIYDMTGNVWERCWDWYYKDYYSNSSEKNPQGPLFGLFRSLRGGSWDYSDINCRISKREYDSPVIKYGILGIRLVRSSV